MFYIFEYITVAVVHQCCTFDHLMYFKISNVFV